MAETIDSLCYRFDGLSTRVDGIDPVLQKILDKLSTMEARHTKSDENIASDLSKLTAAEGRLHLLEHQTQPPPQQFLRLPPLVYLNPFDLNIRGEASTKFMVVHNSDHNTILHMTAARLAGARGFSPFQTHFRPLPKQVDHSQLNLFLHSQNVLQHLPWRIHSC
jgi:hypothetical protein